MARFSAIPARAYFDERITDRHLRLLGLLGLHTDRHGWTWVSQGTLAELMRDPGKKRASVSQGRVSQLLKDLKEWGYVETKPRWAQDGRRLSNYTRVLFDVDDPQQEKEAEKEREDFMPHDESGDDDHGFGLPPDHPERTQNTAPAPAPRPVEPTSATQPLNTPISPGTNIPLKSEEPILAPGLNPYISPGTNRNTPLRPPQVNLIKGAGARNDDNTGALSDNLGIPANQALGEFGFIPAAKPIDPATPTGARRASAARALSQAAQAVEADPALRYRDWFREENWPLAYAFIKAFRAPRNRREATGWTKPLSEMAREGVRPNEVRDAVVEMIMDGITIKSPATIANKAITLAVGRKHGLEKARGGGKRTRGGYQPRPQNTSRLLSPEDVLRQIGAKPNDNPSQQAENPL